VPSVKCFVPCVQFHCIFVPVQLFVIYIYSVDLVFNIPKCSYTHTSAVLYDGCAGRFLYATFYCVYGCRYFSVSFSASLIHKC